MLSLLANTMSLATRQDGWSDPDYRNHQRTARSTAQYEREEAEKQHQSHRNLRIR
ncbi:hypothetical protein [Yoonia sp.]|uniref:hypothetical protein n=1 Tax=Yoonia sp. TaxID=2212373 RepID=UPI003F6A8DD7